MPVYPLGANIVSGRQDQGTVVSNIIAQYDPDAAAYFLTAGVTSPTSKQQINDYVLGLKSQSIWAGSSTWLLRSDQNAGSGITAYVLSGIAANNGTLVNGPTWNSSGIVFSRTAGTYIQIGNLPASSNNYTFMAAVFRTELGQFNGLACGKVGFPNYWSYGAYATDAWMLQDPFELNGGTSSSGSWATVTGYASTSAGCGITVDGAALVTSASNMTAMTPDINIGQFRNAAGTLGFTGNIAYFILFNSVLNFSQIEALRSLTKTTIGSGLAIP